MPQLDPTWFASQLFWLSITFTVLYFVLARIVLPPLQHIVARREGTIEGDIAMAETLKAEAETARQDYERTLTEARDRAQQLINDVMADHKAKAEASNKDMDAQITAKLDEATRRINAKKKELTDALAPATEELTSLIVEKLTHRNTAKDKIGSVITQLFKANNNR
jgi:F-type H+-transporting ATPase subunit b